MADTTNILDPNKQPDMQQLMGNANQVASPTSAQGAQALGANPDQAKMAAAVQQPKPPEPKDNPAAQLSTQERQQDVSQTPVDEQARIKADRIKALGSLNTRVEGMIEAWNRVVKSHHRVLHLGDFAMGPKTAWPAIRAQLNGKITLVRGNHDPSAEKCEALLGPLEHLTTQLGFMDPVMGWVACRHRPEDFTSLEIADSEVLLHGHLHSGKHRPDSAEKASLLDKALCLSVERLPKAPEPLAWEVLQHAWSLRHFMEGGPLLSRLRSETMTAEEYEKLKEAGIEK